MPNAYINKVQLSDGTTLIDLTGDDATESDVLILKKFHLASGKAVTGTLDDFTGATSAANGAHGLVPQPDAGEQDKILFGDGDWDTLSLATNTSSNSIVVGLHKGTRYGPSLDTFSLSLATASHPGLMSAADREKLDGIDAGANAYTLPTASADTKGGVKVGSGLTMTGEVLSADIPTATQSAAGLMSAADKTALDRIGRTVIWENASPTSDFNAQTVTLSDNVANYDFLLIEYMYSATSGYMMSQLTSADVTSIALRVVQAGSNRTGGRNCTVSGTSVDFEAASFNGTTNHAYCVPYRIIGIKL